MENLYLPSALLTKNVSNFVLGNLQLTFASCSSVLPNCIDVRKHLYLRFKYFQVDLLTE